MVETSLETWRVIVFRLWSDGYQCTVLLSEEEYLPFFKTSGNGIAENGSSSRCRAPAVNPICVVVACELLSFKLSVF